MTIEYTGRQTDVAPALRTLAERKLKKLDRLLGGITHAHVIVGVDRHRKTAEVSVHSRRVDLSAAVESGDLAASLAGVLDKLARQAQRHVGRIRERKRRPAGAERVRPSGREEAGREGGAPRVLRSRRFMAKPMTVEEAALEMGKSREGVVVFRDAVTERVSVLYRRSDGNLGLIEPEA